MALSGDRNWRRGNPNWKKGGPSPTPGGRKKGSFVKANAGTHRILRDKKRNPIEELILLADEARHIGTIDGIVIAIDIWKGIHAETTAHSASLERKAREKAVTPQLLGVLEDEDEIPHTQSGTESAGNKASVGSGKSALPSEAHSEGNLRRNPEVSGTDLRDKLLTETGEDDDNGGIGAGDGVENAKQPDSLRSASAGGLEEVPAPHLQSTSDGLSGGDEAAMETV